MNTHVIYPPGPFELGQRDKVIFLAGPIQGAHDWQALAVSLLAAEAKKISAPIPLPEYRLVIANPRAPGEWHKDYNGQVDWETRWLEVASRKGCILFWCAKEAEHYCNRPHGQTTRFELGEWLGRKQVQPAVRLAIGIEDGFTNARYIGRRVSQIRTETMPYMSKLCLTLAEVCDNAFRISMLV